MVKALPDCERKGKRGGKRGRAEGEGWGERKGREGVGGS